MTSQMKSLQKEMMRHFIQICSVLNSVIAYLFILTGFYVLTEIAFFILCNDNFLYEFTFVSDRLQLPLAILPGIFFYIFAQLLVHIAYCIIVGFFAAALIVAHRLPANKHLAFSIAVWIAGIFTIIIANSYYFPNSLFAQLCSVFLSHTMLGVVLGILGLCWITAVLFVLIRLINPIVLLLAITIGILLFQFKASPQQYSSVASAAHPNVIIVGIDSLRPNVLGFFTGEAHTPFINQFLAKAAVFNEAVTPLARTYPSWVGILTGEYPLQTGVRTNLAGLGKANLATTLPAILRQNGYETVYATDESRFSNIDNSFGFDQSITPHSGLNDFLLGTLNDFPISNLLVNSVVGQWLFPYSYANRPANVTYEPDSFLNLLQPALLRDHHKPLFIAAHFCLPHHPYIYADLSKEAFPGQQLYIQSIQRVDQQLSDFFSLLNQAHLLDHAVVVLLSDHGEALELHGDRLTEQEAFQPSHHRAPIFYPHADDEILGMDQTAGHGTDVLGLPQYHSLLAFRLYGLGEQAMDVIPGVVSLLDIKPTVLELACRSYTSCASREGSSTKQQGFSSVSLASQVRGVSTRAPANRMLFLESDYSPDAIRSIFPDTRKLLLEGVDLFQVDPVTARLSVKKDMVEMIIKSKQHAVIYGNWMLAIYPQSDHSKMPILVDLNSGAWTNDLRSPLAQGSPVQSMQHALHAFYGREVL